MIACLKDPPGLLVTVQPIRAVNDNCPCCRLASPNLKCICDEPCGSTHCRGRIWSELSTAVDALIAPENIFGCSVAQTCNCPCNPCGNSSHCETLAVSATWAAASKVKRT